MASMSEMASRAGVRGPRTLADLQNLSKRDPETYRSDFAQQWRHFESNLQIFLLKPTDDAQEFCELVMFVAHLSGCYKDIVEPFPRQVINLLSEHHAVLNSDVRQTLCRALILLRSKELVSSIECLEIFFQLFRCRDKVLREMLFTYIVKDVRQMNAKHKQNKVNKTLQNFMYGMLSDPNQTAAKKSLDVMVALYRKRVWQDAKTVNVVSTALFSDVGKIKTAALRFFLGGDEEPDEDEHDDDNNDKTYQKMIHNTATKKTNKRKNLLKKQLAKEKKKERKDAQPEVFNTPALHLVHDAQGLAEKLFKSLRASKDRWEVQLMMMNLISRLIAVHELLVLNFYPYLERYLWPHKQDVTQVLAYVAQACHEHVPPEVLESLLMKIANNFVSERSAPEVMAVGINAIREISRRCPLAMTEPLMRDLAEYKKYKNKAVMTAAKGLIGAFRELNPELLHKKDRGRPDDDSLLGDRDTKPLQYGEVRPVDFIPGVELLTMDEELRFREAVREAEAAAAAAREGEMRGDADDVVEDLVDDDDEEERDDEEDEGEDGDNVEDSEDGDDVVDIDDAELQSGESADESDEVGEEDEGDGEEDGDDDELAGEDEDGEEEDDDENGEEVEEDEEWSDGSGGWVDVDDEGAGEAVVSPAGASRKKGKVQKARPDDTSRPKRKIQEDDDDDEQEVIRDEVSPEERRRRAIERMRARPLTQEDFDRIRELQLERKLLPSSGPSKRRRSDADEEEDVHARGKYVDEDDILPDVKKAHQSKAERLASVMEGREERGKYNIRRGHEGGTTNRQKEHRKNPMMIKHKLSVRMRALESATSKVAKAQHKGKQFRGKKGWTR